MVGLEDVTDCSLGEDERKQRWFHATAVGLVKDMMAAREGHRNDTLNKLAFRLGSVVAGLGMPIEEAAVALAVAALKSGLSETEVAKTIKSGIEGGMKQPMVWSHS
ncbi:hypothetical protein GA0070563_114180 [Micromonospora carbonacea]|uniref:Uncharacterized protein n=1 Tax=Micromonospora carbonacea TaxID=47853 RepID=A0A1C5AMF4_9ACTN|nr:hypothetical protein GA0070563_114180 [Micromonospora carbonacea]